MDEAGLLAMAARAATLAARMAGDVALVPAPAGVAERRRDRWARSVARGDEARFALRLAQDGLDEQRAAQVLGWSAPLPGSAVPEWARLVDEALAAAGAGAGGPAEVPMGELAAPFVRAARDRLERIAPAGGAGIAPEAAAALERRLLERVAHLLSPALATELAVQRDAEMGPVREAALRAEGWRGRGLHERFVARMLAGGLAAMLADTAALARLTGTVVLGWVAAMAEFRTRLAADRALIGERIGGGPPGVLVGVGSESSDPHRGGRGIVGCRFASGLRAVYKPKSLASEALLAGLLAWLGDRGLEPPFRPLRVLDLGTHGWVEFAAQEPVASAEEVSRFYRRAGGLLALVHALGGDDCHLENLVASGEHPQLVDAETVLKPRLVDVEVRVFGGLPSALEEAGRQAAESVLAVGMLPSWQVSPDGRESMDVSGLGARGTQQVWFTRPQWQDPGTDLARYVSGRAVRTAARNELVRDGVTERCEDHADDVVAGFGRAHALLRARRDELLGPDGPLAALAAAPVRVLFRHTQLYASALGAATGPRELREGVDRSIALEVLARPLLDRADAAAHWPVLRQELRDLEDGDVPYLAVRGDATELRLPGSGVGVPFERSALDRARERLLALDADDLRMQTALIRAALAARAEAPQPQRRRAWRGAGDPGAAALAAGRLLAGSAIRGPRGGLAWVGPSLVHASARVILRPSGLDLYEGLAGVGVFLAALAAATGAREWRGLARECLAPLLEAAELAPHRLPLVLGVGGAGGVGGMLHGLVSAARLLDDAEPVQAAARLAAGVGPDALSAASPDLLGGLAGLVLGLLAVHDATGDTDALATARRAGDLVVAAQRPMPEGGAAWRVQGAPALCHPSHGASGIALALARLADAAGDPAHEQAAGLALDFEAACFDPGAGAWPDRRPPPAGGFSGGWCHGAAGSALVRAGLLGTATGRRRAAGLDRDIAAALAFAAANPPSQDHLCCGSAGVAEVARTPLGDRPDAGPLRRTADAWAADAAARLLAGEPLSLFARSLAGLPTPGLYTGVAGVGYALLARAEPALPVPLAWG